MTLPVAALLSLLPPAPGVFGSDGVTRALPESGEPGADSFPLLVAAMGHAQPVSDPLVDGHHVAPGLLEAGLLEAGRLGLKALTSRDEAPPQDLAALVRIQNLRTTIGTEDAGSQKQEAPSPVASIPQSHTRDRQLSPSPFTPRLFPISDPNAAIPPLLPQEPSSQVPPSQVPDAIAPLVSATQSQAALNPNAGAISSLRTLHRQQPAPDSSQTLSPQQSASQQSALQQNIKELGLSSIKALPLASKTAAPTAVSSPLTLITLADDAPRSASSPPPSGPPSGPPLVPPSGPPSGPRFSVPSPSSAQPTPPASFGPKPLRAQHSKNHEHGRPNPPLAATQTQASQAIQLSQAIQTPQGSSSRHLAPPPWARSFHRPPSVDGQPREAAPLPLSSLPSSPPPITPVDPPLFSSSLLERSADTSPLAEKAGGDEETETHILKQSLGAIARGLKNAGQSYRITLNPADLGQLEVHLDLAAEKTAQLHISAESNEVLEFLQRHQGLLEQSLKDSGFDGQRFSFSLLQQQQDQQQRHAPPLPLDAPPSGDKKTAAASLLPPKSTHHGTLDVCV